MAAALACQEVARLRPRAPPSRSALLAAGYVLARRLRRSRFSGPRVLALGWARRRRPAATCGLEERAPVAALGECAAFPAAEQGSPGPVPPGRAALGTPAAARRAARGGDAAADVLAGEAARGPAESPLSAPQAEARGSVVGRPQPVRAPGAGPARRGRVRPGRLSGVPLGRGRRTGRGARAGGGEGAQPRVPPTSTHASFSGSLPPFHLFRWCWENQVHPRIFVGKVFRGKGSLGLDSLCRNLQFNFIQTQ